MFSKATDFSKATELNLIIQFDPTKYPPVPIADEKRGRRRTRRLELQRARFTKKTPFFPILATLRVLESSLLSIRALFDAFKRL